MRVYIDDDGLHLFFEFAQGNFAKSHALLQNQAEQLFKSLRGGGFFYFFKGLLQCLLRSYSRRDAPTTDGRLHGRAAAAYRVPHNSGRKYERQSASAIHRHFARCCCGGLGQFCLRDMEGLGGNCVCRCLYGSTAPHIKGERLRILTQLVACTFSREMGLSW